MEKLNFVKCVYQGYDEDIYVSTLPGDTRAVRVSWGYATGRDEGLHNHWNSWAYAELGTWTPDDGFEPDVWTQEDRNNREIFTDQAIGLPKSYRTWNPPKDLTCSDTDFWDDFLDWEERAVYDLFAET